MKCFKVSIPKNDHDFNYTLGCCHTPPGPMHFGSLSWTVQKKPTALLYTELQKPQTSNSSKSTFVFKVAAILKVTSLVVWEVDSSMLWTLIAFKTIKNKTQNTSRAPVSASITWGGSSINLDWVSAVRRWTYIYITHTLLTLLDFIIKTVTTALSKDLQAGRGDDCKQKTLREKGKFCDK